MKHLIPFRHSTETLSIRLELSFTPDRPDAGESDRDELALGATHSGAASYPDIGQYLLH
jgi:hypothetical protein